EVPCVREFLVFGIDRSGAVENPLQLVVLGLLRIDHGRGCVVCPGPVEPEDVTLHDADAVDPAVWSGLEVDRCDSFCALDRWFEMEDRNRRGVRTAVGAGPHHPD